MAAAAAAVLKRDFSGLKIAGAESGGEIIDPFFTDEDLIGRINDAAPRILLVALGQGKQEKWIFAHLDKLPSVKLAVGVGGSFDYISGLTPRAPKFLRRAGLEWLYRLIREPKRWPRILNAIIVFPLLILKEKIFGKKNPPPEISGGTTD